MTTISDFSRFKHTELLIEDGAEVFGTWNPPEYISGNIQDDKIANYKVNNTVEGRPDLISNELYGTPHFDWVLIAFNNPTEILNWPKAGLVIKYPIRSIVLTNI